MQFPFYLFPYLQTVLEEQNHFQEEAGPLSAKIFLQLLQKKTLYYYCVLVILFV